MQKFNWYEHLCDYHNVSLEKVIELGTRSSGRKPDLPGSETCKKVSNMTYEDIWALKDRSTNKKVFEFYKDQGSWSTFRQCVRHSNMVNQHIGFLNIVSKVGLFKENFHFCEYGAGVAPFATTLLNYIDKNSQIEITICDVDSDHFDFAKYRLNRIKNDHNFNNLKLNFLEIKPDNLPIFKNKIDATFCFEVLEHVPSPLAVIKNITKIKTPGSIYVENFIKHDDLEDDDDGPDLSSARSEREVYYEYLHENYDLIHPSHKESKDNPSTTRIWQKNTL